MGLDSNTDLKFCVVQPSNTGFVDLCIITLLPVYVIVHC